MTHPQSLQNRGDYLAPMQAVWKGKEHNYVAYCIKISSSTCTN